MGTDTPPNCDICGRFVAFKPGASWSQQYYQSMGGSKELEDPYWRCATCTTAHGVGATNCAPGYGQGIIPPQDQTP